MCLPSIQTRTRWNDRKPSVVVFDVNETLIDIEGLNPLFERVFGDGRVCASDSATFLRVDGDGQETGYRP